MVNKTTPQSWLPKIPMEDFNALIFIIITAISIGLMIFGYIGYKRRDMIERA